MWEHGQASAKKESMETSSVASGESMDADVSMDSDVEMPAVVQVC